MCYPSCTYFMFIWEMSYELRSTWTYVLLGNYFFKNSRWNYLNLFSSDVAQRLYSLFDTCMCTSHVSTTSQTKNQTISSNWIVYNLRFNFATSWTWLIELLLVFFGGGSQMIWPIILFQVFCIPAYHAFGIPVDSRKNLRYSMERYSRWGRWFVAYLGLTLAKLQIPVYLYPRQTQ